MATTTRPQTTSANVPTSQNAPVSGGSNPTTEQCKSGSIPDYNTLRQQNLNKISGYYSQLLSSYTQSYRDYSTQTASANVNDRLYARNTLKPKVDNYNTQLIKVSQNMIDNVNQDTDLILSQKDELTNKTRQIDQMINNITLLKEKDNEMSVLTRAREDSLNSAEHSKEDMQFYTYVYMGVCVLLLFIIIGIVIYLVYSNYTLSSGIGNRNNITTSTS